MISCHSLNSFLDGKGQPTVTTTKNHRVSRKIWGKNSNMLRQHFLGGIEGSELWVSWSCTLPKTNMAPENRPSQTSIPTYSNRNHPFSGVSSVSFREGKIFQAGVVEPFLTHISTCAGQTCDQRCRSTNSDGTWLLFPSAPFDPSGWVYFGQGF